MNFAVQVLWCKFNIAAGFSVDRNSDHVYSNLNSNLDVADFPMSDSDAAQEYSSPIPSPRRTSSEPVDGQFLSDADSNSGGDIDYHPFINGNLFDFLFDAS